MTHLWEANDPARFWQCQPAAPPGQWLAAAREASAVLALDQPWHNFGTLLELTLGEGRYGPEHWQLGWKKTIYYRLKPLLPRPLTRLLRQLRATVNSAHCFEHWPIDKRYVHFQWELLRQLLILQGRSSVSFTRFWPQQKQFAFILTHDIETAKGQSYTRAVADLEESLGFRSSFNFVPERYALDWGLIHELQERGFEIGVHGLKHDGRLFSSRRVFEQRLPNINHYLEQFQAVGYRSPSTIRHPAWMQELEIEYDLSFFDTDPYEPIPGGTMSIWPFMLGHFVELPYTLVQDYTLTRVLKQTSPQVWLDKIEFIRRYGGMALINTHPDYLQHHPTGQVYQDFLVAMKKSERDFWHALPRDAAAWWRKRHTADVHDHADLGQIMLTQHGIELC